MRAWQANPWRTAFALIIGAILIWMVLSIWPEWLKDILGRKKTFVNTLLNGLTLAGLYFLVASGFTLIFGLMRNVNLAHGSMYLLGGYIGYEVAEASGNWLLGAAAAFMALSVIGAALQVTVFRRMQGDDLRQTLVTIGISIIAADLMMAAWGGTTYQFQPPESLFGAVQLPIISMIKSTGAVVYIKYPFYRLFMLMVAIVIGVALWLFINRTRTGMMVRAGVDDRRMLAATGIILHAAFTKDGNEFKRDSIARVPLPRKVSMFT